MTAATLAAATPAKPTLLGKVLRSSPIAKHTFIFTAKVILLAAVFVVDYFLVTVAAVEGVPLIMAFVMNGTGVTLDMGLDTIVAAWFVPALFFVGMLFVLTLFVIRAIWRLRGKAITRFTAAVNNVADRPAR